MIAKSKIKISPFWIYFPPTSEQSLNIKAEEEQLLMRSLVTPWKQNIRAKILIKEEKAQKRLLMRSLVAPKRAKMREQNIRTKM